MNQALRSSTAASIVLASILAGCAAPGAQTGAATSFGGQVGDVGLATRALEALNSNKVPQAIQLAEQAVAKSPTDAGFRALLGNAYFAGGRFRSAEAAYTDSLTIYPNQAQVMLKLALVQIALGKKNQAIATLNDARPALGESNYGLAMTLAGRTADAIRVLEPVARDANADATVRQNLALAYAFAGNWDNARAIAAQDVPAGQIDARIHQWMQLTSPKSPAEQVASLVGVTPAAVDEGQPVRLALSRPQTQVPATQLAQAAPPAKAPAPVAPAAPAPAPVVALAAAPAAVPAPVVVVAASIPPAPPPARPTLAAMAATAVSEAKAVFASVMPHSNAPIAKPKSHFVAAAAHRGNSPAVVQLGAYGSPNRVLTAWNGTAAKYGVLKAYVPMSAKFVSAKGIFYRLSVRGFGSDAEARNVCMSLRRQGGSCFVRNSSGDQPVHYAMR
ncbi:MAG: tetratricopeptide repeat protein [Pseudomonadota bacterium]